MKACQPVCAGHEVSCLRHWIPFVELARVPRPKTKILTTELALLPLAVGQEVEGFEAFAAMVRAACDHVGYPAFLRTGHTAGKQGWGKTCYITTPDQIIDNMIGLIIYSQLVSNHGLPINTWVVREYMSAEPIFYAFKGMPIRLERRYFVRDGEVVCHHPYWHESVFKPEQIANKGWRHLLKRTNVELDVEVRTLTTLSKRIAREIGGAWSIDWLWTRDRGWVCTDMAAFDRSWHWPDCKASQERPSAVKHHVERESCSPVG